MTATTASTDTLFWKVANNTFLSTSLILATGALLVLGLFHFASGVAHIALSVSSSVAILWALLGFYVSNGSKSSILALLLSLIMVYLSNRFEYVFYEPLSTVQIAEPVVTITSGLLGDTYYMAVPETIQVNKEAISIDSPYVIRTQTSEGLLEKVFVCESEKLASGCGIEM